MNSTEKEISYKTNNTYSTLNTINPTTKRIWLVCHGMGYLSRYFLKYFKDLDPSENYIIAPQAPSKYYIQPKMHVGANWLTKDNTDQGTDNIMNYFDAIFEAEQIPKDANLIVFGYSQGVSVAMRYVAKRQLQCSQLVMHSGGIPKELKAEEFSFLNAKISLIYGVDDEYLDDERMQYETNRVKELFGEDITVISFEGKHEVNVALLNSLV